MRCTKAVIYRENIINNLMQVKSVLKPHTKICVAVKADGYGTSALETAKIASSLDIDYLAVATVDEAKTLRENGINLKILLLSLCSPEEFNDLFQYKITPLVFDLNFIEELEKSANKNSLKDFDVFLAVDTGMGRIGCLKDEASFLAQKIASSKVLKLSGMITHFAVSDSISKENIDYTNKQFLDFKYAIDSVKEKGIDPGLCTCSSSAAALAFPDFQLDMVRPGIIVYGYYPDEVSKQYLKLKKINVDFKPVMQFETQVVAIRHFKKGNSISYGRQWICEKDTDIAVLPVGYADGLLRRNSPGLEVTINGKLYPVCGRICMDQCMVDIGLNNKDVKRWDKAIIFGPKDKGSLLDADDIAKKTLTISYEVMTSVSSRVKRYII